MVFVFISNTGRGSILLLIGFFALKYFEVLSLKFIFNSSAQCLVYLVLCIFFPQRLHLKLIILHVILLGVFTDLGCKCSGSYMLGQYFLSCFQWVQSSHCLYWVSPQGYSSGLTWLGFFLFLDFIFFGILFISLEVPFLQLFF